MTPAEREDFVRELQGAIQGALSNFPDAEMLRETHDAVIRLSAVCEARCKITNGLVEDMRGKEGVRKQIHELEKQVDKIQQICNAGKWLVGIVLTAIVGTIVAGWHFIKGQGP